MYHKQKFEVSLENCKKIINEKTLSDYIFDKALLKGPIVGVLFDGKYAESDGSYPTGFYKDVIVLCQNICEGGHPTIPKMGFDCTYAIKRKDFDKLVKMGFIKVYNREEKLRRILG